METGETPRWHAEAGSVVALQAGQKEAESLEKPFAKVQGRSSFSLLAVRHNSEKGISAKEVMRQHLPV